MKKLKLVLQVDDREIEVVDLSDFEDFDDAEWKNPSIIETIGQAVTDHLVAERHFQLALANHKPPEKT